MVIEKTRQFIEDNSEQFKQKFEADGIDYEDARSTVLSGQIELGLASLLDSSDLTLAEQVDKYYEKLKAEYEKQKAWAIEQVVSGATDIITEQVDNLSDTVWEHTKSWVTGLLPDWFQKFTPVTDAVGGIIGKITSWIKDGFNSLMWWIIGLIPISVAAPVWTESENQDSVEDGPGVVDEIGQGDAEWVNDVQEEEKESGIDVNKSATYETIWYKIIALQSWIKKEDNKNTLATYDTVWAMSLDDIYGKLKEVDADPSIDVISAFWLNPNTDPKLAKDAIVSIVWPFSWSLLRSTFSQISNIKQLLFIDDANTFTQEAREIFSMSEMSHMKAVQYDYSKMPFSVVSRLTALYWKNRSVSWYAHLTQSISDTGNSVQEFILWWELMASIQALWASKKQSDIYPKNFANLFRNILWTDSLWGSAEELRQSEHGKDIAFTASEIQKLDKFVLFRDKSIEVIRKEYGLGMDNFEVIFDRKNDLAAIITLYLLLDGKDIDSLDNNEKLIVHTWVYEVLGNEKWKYRAAILDALTKENSELNEDQKNILTIIFFRFLETNRNETLSLIKTTLDTGHETLKDIVIPAIPKSLKIEKQNEDALMYILQGSGALILWKVLAFTPHIRAALFVASGLTLWAVYLFAQDSVYASLNHDIQTKYNTFLEEHIWWGSGSQIRQDIVSGKIDTDKLIEKLKDVDIDELVSP